MLRPDFDQFAQLAREATLVPVAKSITADLATPVSAFLALAAGEPHAFLLESVEGGEKIGRYTFLGARPYMVMTARGQEITLVRGRHRERRRGNVFAVLRELLEQHRPAAVPGLPPFTAGAVGFLSYDAVRQLEKLPQRARRDLDVPDCALMFFDRLLAFDHLRHQIHIVAAANVKEESPQRAYQRALADIAAIEKRLAAGARPRDLAARRPVKGKLKVRSVTRPRDFLAAVRRIKQSIVAGDIIQAVLSPRWDFEPGVDPFHVYRALRTVNPSPYMSFLRLGDTHVLGASPEMLVKVSGRKLEYHPIFCPRKPKKSPSCRSRARVAAAICGESGPVAWPCSSKPERLMTSRSGAGPVPSFSLLISSRAKSSW